MWGPFFRCLVLGLVLGWFWVGFGLVLGLPWLVVCKKLHREKGADLKPLVVDF